MNILVVDVGGTNVKVWKTGEADKVKFPSGRSMTPADMVDGVKEAAEGWTFDRVSIGYPGQLTNGRPSEDPYNLGPGWVDFDYSKAFKVPVRIMNDACMQALGSYEGGRMLYLGLGTSMGTAFIFNDQVIPLALGHLKFKRGESFEHFLGREGFESYGEKDWHKAVVDAATTLRAAFLADYVVLGGGNAKKLGKLCDRIRRGSNHNAYFGGIRMWEDAEHVQPPIPPIGAPAFA